MVYLERYRGDRPPIKEEHKSTHEEDGRWEKKEYGTRGFLSPTFVRKKKLGSAGECREVSWKSRGVSHLEMLPSGGKNWAILTGIRSWKQMEKA